MKLFLCLALVFKSVMSQTQIPLPSNCTVTMRIAGGGGGAGGTTLLTSVWNFAGFGGSSMELLLKFDTSDNCFVIIGRGGHSAYLFSDGTFFFNGGGGGGGSTAVICDGNVYAVAGGGGGGGCFLSNTAQSFGGSTGNIFSPGLPGIDPSSLGGIGGPPGTAGKTLSYLLSPISAQNATAKSGGEGCSYKIQKFVNEGGEGFTRGGDGFTFRGILYSLVGAGGGGGGGGYYPNAIGNGGGGGCDDTNSGGGGGGASFVDPLYVPFYFQQAIFNGASSPPPSVTQGGDGYAIVESCISSATPTPSSTFFPSPSSTQSSTFSHPPSSTSAASSAPLSSTTGALLFFAGCGATGLLGLVLYGLYKFYILRFASNTVSSKTMGFFASSSGREPLISVN